MTVKSKQHFTEQAQTELAINLLTEKIPKGKRSKVWLKKIKTSRRAANATKQLREKRGEKRRVNGRQLKGQYTFSRTQCVQVTRLTINKIEKIGINNHKMVKFHEINF